MIVNKPVLQHHTPRVHLQHFVDREGFLHVFTKEKAYKAVPEKVARERNFCEYRLGKEESSYKIEETLSSLEAYAAPLYPKLQSGAVLSLEEIMKWALYLASLFLRSRKMRDDFAVGMATETFARDIEGDEALREMQHELLKQGKLIPIAELRRVAQEQITSMLSQPAYLHFMNFAERVPKFAWLLSNKTWTVSRIEHGSFFTTDMPVCTARIEGGKLYPGYGIERENTITFMALSPTSLFVSGDAASTRFAPIIPEESVDVINACMVQFASSEVYSDHFSEGRRSIVQENINSLIFGKNTFMQPSAQLQQ